MTKYIQLIPDFSRLLRKQEKSAPSDSEGLQDQTRREFGLFCRVSQILQLHKIVPACFADEKNPGLPRKIGKSSSDLSNDPFGANFACRRRAKFGLIIIAGFLLLNGAVSAEQPQETNTTLNYYDARAFNNRGVEFISQAKNEDAIKEFQKALVVDPNFYVARYNLALAYYNIGKVHEAIAEFKYLVNNSYYLVNAHYNLGTIYLRQQMWDEAIEQLKIVTELEPAHAEGHFNLGYIYFKKGLLDEAISEYNKALILKPDMVKGHLSLAFIYEKKGLDKEALGEYSVAVNLKPDYPEALQAQNSLKAIVQIKDALKQKPSEICCYLHMGHIYYAREMYQEALDSYNMALQYQPANEMAKGCAQKAALQLTNLKDAKADTVEQKLQ